jgi:hypothetical protein
MTTEINRIARTEALFRDVNERIAEVAEHLGTDDAEFVCECADVDCGERVEVSLDEYEMVREDGARFLVAPGHEEPDYEQVLVARKGNHKVIAKSKDPRLARAARELDPRAEEEPPPTQASEMK